MYSRGPEPVVLAFEPRLPPLGLCIPPPLSCLLSSLPCPHFGGWATSGVILLPYTYLHLDKL